MHEEKKQIVERLLPFLVEKQNFSEVYELICADVISHMDQYSVRGLQVWIQWVRFINSRGRVGQLDTILESMVVNPDGSVTASGRWKANYKGKATVSHQISATYKIQDGKIVEIWTKRTNYTFIIGSFMQSRLGLVCVLLYFMLWSRWHPSPIFRSH